MSNFKPNYTNRQEPLSSTRLGWFALSALDLSDDGSAGQNGQVLIEADTRNDDFSLVQVEV